MQSWDLLTLEAAGAREPKVVIEDDGARAVLIVLAAGEALGEHVVKEHAWVIVLDGAIEASTEGTADPETFAQGRLLRWEPREAHTIASPTGARLLLILAPWPGPGHFDASELGATSSANRVTAAPGS